MKRSKLLLVIKEAQEMIDRSRLLLEKSDSETDDLIDGPLNSSVRRQSMELTRALSGLRKYWD